jgi:uncharacterized protein HemX
MAPAVPWIIAGVTTVGAGVAAYGQRQAGKQEQKMQEINAKQQEQDSLDRQAETIAQSREMRQDQERATSTQRSQYAHGNVLMEGTPLQVMVETAADFKMKQLNLERQGQHESNLLRRGAAISRYKGVQARKAGNIASVGTILSGVAQAGSAYMGART